MLACKTRGELQERSEALLGRLLCTVRMVDAKEMSASISAPQGEQTSKDRLRGRLGREHLNALNARHEVESRIGRQSGEVLRQLEAACEGQRGVVGARSRLGVEASNPAVEALTKSGHT